MNALNRPLSVIVLAAALPFASAGEKGLPKVFSDDFAKGAERWQGWAGRS